MTIRQIFVGLCLFVALAGCENRPVDTSSNTFMRNSVRTIAASLKARPTEPFVMTRSRLAGVTFPVLWIEIFNTEASGSAIPIGFNRGMVTWVSANAVTILTKDGVIFGTRGLGPDMLSTQTDPLQAALRSRSPARYSKIYRFVEGDEHIHKERYFCELTVSGAVQREVLGYVYDTTQFVEACYGLNGAREFRNVYWLGEDGTVWDSTQWISRDAGYVSVQTLIN